MFFSSCCSLSRLTAMASYSGSVKPGPPWSCWAQADDSAYASNRPDTNRVRARLPRDVDADLCLSLSMNAFRRCHHLPYDSWLKNGVESISWQTSLQEERVHPLRTAELYRQRGEVELFFRHIKTTLRLETAHTHAADSSRICFTRWATFPTATDSTATNSGTVLNQRLSILTPQRQHEPRRVRTEVTFLTCGTGVRFRGRDVFAAETCDVLSHCHLVRPAADCDFPSVLALNVSP